MAGEQDVAFEQLQVVVESLDAFQVQMICRSVQNKTVGVFQLHAGYHTTHLLSSRKHVDFLHYLFSREQHSSEEALEVNFVAFTELAQPIHKVQIAFEEAGVVERQICRSNGHSPFVVASLCFTVTVDDFKKSRHGTRVAAQENDFISFFHGKIHVIEKHGPVVRCGT